MIPDEPDNEQPDRFEGNPAAGASESKPTPDTKRDRPTKRSPRAQHRITAPPHAIETALQTAKAFRTREMQQAIGNAQSLASATQLQGTDLRRLSSVADSPPFQSTMQSAYDSIAQMSLPYLDETMRKLSESMAPLLGAQQTALQSLAKQAVESMNAQMGPLMDALRSMESISLRTDLASVVASVNMNLGAFGFRDYGPRIPVPSDRVIEIVDQGIGVDDVAVEVNESARKEALEIGRQLVFALYTISVLLTIFAEIELGYPHYLVALSVITGLVGIYQLMKQSFPDVFGGDDD